MEPVYAAPGGTPWFDRLRRQRRYGDYEDKPDEYLISGVGEYWIVDSIQGRFTAFSRYRGQRRPKVLKPAQRYTTNLLPGFTLDLKRVFAAAA